MNRAIVLSHRAVAHELGNIGAWFELRYYEVTHVYREDITEDSLVSLDHVEGDILFVLGSPSSVADGYCLAPAQQEIELVRQWVFGGRKYVGICFGAQVLACALGGSVRRMDQPFRAFTEMTLTPSAPEVVQGNWAVWHEDTITAPVGAEVMARLPHADTIFRVGNAWGIQPHIEFTSEIVERLATTFKVDSPDVAALVDGLRASEADHARRTHELLDYIAN
jgi:GMP synthase-like glutamine amidotransferase